MARDPNFPQEPSSAVARTLPDRGAGAAGSGYAGICAGLRGLSDSRDPESRPVWFGVGQSLHRRVAKERQDHYDVRSTANLGLREGSVPARGIVAMLVFAPTPGPAYGYLIRGSIPTVRGTVFYTF